MSDDTPDIEATWTHATSEIPARGLDAKRSATAAERAALAAELDILGIEHLAVRYRIAPLAGDRFRLSGTIEARVVQACVVTLDPVEATIEESVDVEFRPAAALSEGAGPSEAEQSALSAEEHEPIEHNRLAIGRIVAETLAASLPAYPRAPGAALDRHEAGPGEASAESPFAALAGWKPKPE